MEMIAMGVVGILAAFLWGTVQRSFQAALLSLIPSIPLGAGLSTLAVTMYCSQSGGSMCGILVVFTFPVAVIFAYALTLFKLYGTPMFKPFFGFVLGATIVFVAFGDYHIYETTHIVRISSLPMLITAIVGGFVGAYISSANLPYEKSKGNYDDYRA